MGTPNAQQKLVESTFDFKTLTTALWYGTEVFWQGRACTVLSIERVDDPDLMKLVVNQHHEVVMLVPTVDRNKIRLRFELRNGAMSLSITEAKRFEEAIAQ